MKKRAFTLAEVLITLAIIGVVAAISIPSVVANTQQKEFQTGLRKAVSVLNSAITMNMALDGETPYENKDLYNYLMKHMSILKSSVNLPYYTCYDNGKNCNQFVGDNSVFYTTDGMRFEFHHGSWIAHNWLRLHENKDIAPCISSGTTKCGGCGSYGLNSNSDNTTKPPCLIMVDVNGDRKPTPGNVNCTKQSCGKSNQYKASDPNGKKLMDIFTIMITDKQAIPYGVAAQRAMYQAQKSK